MEQIVDPVFGALLFESHDSAVGLWKKQDHLELMGGLIPLEIEGNAEGPTEDQRQTYFGFKQAAPDLRNELQETLLQFYQTQREIYAYIYAEICNDESQFSAEDFIPVLAKPEDIWGIITPNSWTILSAESAHYQLEAFGIKFDTMLVWHGCWDIEHEFSMLFQSGKFLGFESLESFYSLHDLQVAVGDTGN